MIWIAIFVVLCLILSTMFSNSNSRQMDKMTEQVKQEVSETGKVSTLTMIGTIATLVSAMIYIGVFGFLAYMLLRLSLH